MGLSSCSSEPLYRGWGGGGKVTLGTDDDLYLPVVEGVLQVFKQPLKGGCFRLAKVKDRWEHMETRDRKISSEALVFQSSFWGGGRKDEWAGATVRSLLKEELIYLRGLHGMEDQAGKESWVTWLEVRKLA